MSKSGPPPAAIWIQDGLDERGNMVAYVKSTTRPGVWHPIVVNRSGTIFCGCEIATFKYNGYAPQLIDSACCKHVHEFRDVLLRELAARYPRRAA